jgi:hypothetical protein
MCGRKFTTQNRTNKEGERKSSYGCINKIYHNDDIACELPSISHEKVENAFIKYIENIDEFTPVDKVKIDDNAAKKEDELLKYIADLERKNNDLQNRKKKITERYVNGEIMFEEYKEMIVIFKEKREALEGELQRTKADISLGKETPNILPEDVILNLKENWENLNNNEKMIFLQRFVKKINIKVEKEHEKSNIVKIQGIEFNPISKPIKEKQEKKAIRKNLKIARHR